MKKLTKDEKDKLLLAIGADTISLKDDIYTVRKGFFYTGGMSSRTIADRVIKHFANNTVTIVDKGEVWKHFKGGATVAQSSHFWVKFKLQ